MLVQNVTLKDRCPCVTQEFIHVVSSSDECAIRFFEGYQRWCGWWRYVLVSCTVVFRGALLLSPRLSCSGVCLCGPLLVVVLVDLQKFCEKCNSFKGNFARQCKERQQLIRNWVVTVMLKLGAQLPSPVKTLRMARCVLHDSFPYHTNMVLKSSYLLK